ncbi:MAG: ABC transporter permease [Acidobacteriota bacterium]
MGTLKNAFRQLLRDLKSQRLRTFLTLFGIVWGTVAVSLLLAFGAGFHQFLRQRMSHLGQNVVFAWPSLTSMPYEGFNKGRPIHLTEEDIEAVSDQVRDLAGISVEYRSSMTVRNQAKTMSVHVSGVSPSYATLRNLGITPGGRFLDPIDLARQRQVAFIGGTLAKELFHTKHVVGRRFEINGSPFMIVGVLKLNSQESGFGGREAEHVWIPATTFTVLTGQKYISDFLFKAPSAIQTPRVKKDVVAALAARQRFNPKDTQAISMWDTSKAFAFLDTFMLGFQLFLGIVGSITLIVGGIGVSNIMHVVVEERSRETGIKMALGAHGSWVRRQFLVETMIVTVFGGALGLLISSGICALFSHTHLTHFVGHPTLSSSVALLTAGILGIVGIVAGYGPAKEASKLDPVVAMKMG